MKRFSFTIGAVLVSAALTLTYAATAKAAGNGHGHGNGSHNHGGHHNGGNHNGHVHNVSHMHGATHYRHRDFHHWTRYCWFPGHGCYGYYCPDDREWYYWYGPSNCYLPVSEMATYEPDDSVNAPPSLPPGATLVS
jgi:hypothetical protein